MSDSIRVTLLEWENLDDHIEKSPLEFLFISYKLHWARVYKECFIHTVGVHCGKLGVPATSMWADSDFSIPDPVALSIQSECDRINQLLFAAMRKLLYLNGDETSLERQICNKSVRNDIGRYFSLYGNPGQEGLLFREIAGSTFTPTSEDRKRCRDFSYYIQLAVGEIKTLASGLAKNNLSSKRITPHLTCAEAKIPWL